MFLAMLRPRGSGLASGGLQVDRSGGNNKDVVRHAFLLMTGLLHGYICRGSSITGSQASPPR